MTYVMKVDIGSAAAFSHDAMVSGLRALRPSTPDMVHCHFRKVFARKACLQKQVMGRAETRKLAQLFRALEAHVAQRCLQIMPNDDAFGFNCPAL